MSCRRADDVAAALGRELAAAAAAVRGGSVTAVCVGASLSRGCVAFSCCMNLFDESGRLLSDEQRGAVLAGVDVAQLLTRVLTGGAHAAGGSRASLQLSRGIGVRHLVASSSHAPGSVADATAGVAAGMPPRVLGAQAKVQPHPHPQPQVQLSLSPLLVAPRLGERKLSLQVSAVLPAHDPNSSCCYELTVTFTAQRGVGVAPPLARVPLATSPPPDMASQQRLVGLKLDLGSWLPQPGTVHVMLMDAGGRMVASDATPLLPRRARGAVAELRAMALPADVARAIALDLSLVVAAPASRRGGIGAAHAALVEQLAGRLGEWVSAAGTPPAMAALLRAAALARRAACCQYPWCLSLALLLLPLPSLQLPSMPRCWLPLRSFRALPLCWLPTLPPFQPAALPPPSPLTTRPLSLPTVLPLPLPMLSPLSLPTRPLFVDASCTRALLNVVIMFTAFCAGEVLCRVEGLGFRVI
uniref:Uncharacterized protein n=2 Tax=Chlamydomonas euryale TaxID=1486919 RepID=A0A7R9YTA6_9CHLO